MSLTKIYATSLDQGTNEIYTLREALAGSWGDSGIYEYTGNIVHGFISSGAYIEGPSKESLAIVCFTDGTYDITHIEAGGTKQYDKTVAFGVIISKQ